MLSSALFASVGSFGEVRSRFGGEREKGRTIPAPEMVWWNRWRVNDGPRRHGETVPSVQFGGSVDEFRQGTVLREPDSTDFVLDG